VVRAISSRLAAGGARSRFTSCVTTGDLNGCASSTSTLCSALLWLGMFCPARNTSITFPHAVYHVTLPFVLRGSFRLVQARARARAQTRQLLTALRSERRQIDLFIALPFYSAQMKPLLSRDSYELCPVAYILRVVRSSLPTTLMLADHDAPCYPNRCFLALTTYCSRRHDFLLSSSACLQGLSSTYPPSMTTVFWGIVACLVTYSSLQPSTYSPVLQSLCPFFSFSTSPHVCYTTDFPNTTPPMCTKDL